MKSMRSFVTASLVLAVPTLLLSSADGAIFGRSTVTSSLKDVSTSSPSSGHFGLTKTVSRFPRGGAEEAVEEPAPEVLYLAGLLETAIERTKQVRR
jgi:hypothetical protein